MSNTSNRKICHAIVYPCPHLSLKANHGLSEKQAPGELSWRKINIGLGKGLVLIKYRKLSNISRTKSQNLNDSCLVLHLSLSNLLKPGVK